MARTELQNNQASGSQEVNNMCTGGSGSTGKAMNAIIPITAGIPPFMKKPMLKVAEVATPSFMKGINDKLMPTEVRQELIKGGGKKLVSNPTSEEEEAQNRALAEEESLKLKRAFAAKYNNQVKML